MAIGFQAWLDGVRRPGWGHSRSVTPCHSRSSMGASLGAVTISSVLAQKRINRQFGMIVRRIRSERGLTQESLASRANLHPTYVSGLERGVRNPSLDVLSRLAKAFGMKLSEIVMELD